MDFPIFTSKIIDDNQSSYQDELLNQYLNISNDILNIVNTNELSELLKYNSFLVKEKQSSNYNLSSFFTSLDSEDSIEENIIDKSISQKEVITSKHNLANKISIDSTDIDDINKANSVFDSMLRKRSPMFIWTLCHTDFEDGVSNCIIDEVESSLKKNKYVTITWLHSLYAQNQKNQDILAGLLRIIGMTIKTEDSDKLLTMVIAGLTEPCSKTQEAALMVIEEWRTKNCLEALKNRSFNTQWISNYAKIVERELINELEDGN